jgi:hypothetical protein
MCDHKHARCVETTEPEETGWFVEHYECECGAIGSISGKEQDPPRKWTRTGEVFR